MGTSSSMRTGRGIKVLMLSGRLNTGGTETYMLTLGAKLKQLGVQVGVASRGGPLSAAFRKSGFQVHRLPGPGRQQPSVYLRKLAARHGYRWLHAHDTPSFRWLSGMRAAGGPLPRFAMTLHGKYHGKAPMRRAARRASLIVAGSPVMFRWAVRHGVPPSKIRFLPNGIDTSRFRPDRRQQHWKTRLGMGRASPLVAYAGRFQAPKHLVAKRLIEAAPHVLGHYRHGKVVLAGPGPYRPMLRRLAKKANRMLGRQGVVVRPVLRDVRRLYWASDAVVGTGRVALEAMACGKPVLAAGVSGYSGPVTDKSFRRSILIHFGDHGAAGRLTPGRLAAGLLDILKHPRSLRHAGKFGRRATVRMFSAHTLARNMLRAYVYGNQTRKNRVHRSRRTNIH